jgi:hypothetical protein
MVFFSDFGFFSFLFLPFSKLCSSFTNLNGSPLPPSEYSNFVFIRFVFSQTFLSRYPDEPEVYYNRCGELWHMFQTFMHVYTLYFVQYGQLVLLPKSMDS